MSSIKDRIAALNKKSELPANEPPAARIRPVSMGFKSTNPPPAFSAPARPTSDTITSSTDVEGNAVRRSSVADRIAALKAAGGEGAAENSSATVGSGTAKPVSPAPSNIADRIAALKSGSGGGNSGGGTSGNGGACNPSSPTPGKIASPFCVKPSPAAAAATAAAAAPAPLSTGDSPPDNDGIAETNPAVPSASPKPTPGKLNSPFMNKSPMLSPSQASTSSSAASSPKPAGGGNRLSANRAAFAMQLNMAGFNPGAPRPISVPKPAIEEESASADSNAAGELNHLAMSRPMAPKRAKKTERKKTHMDGIETTDSILTAAISTSATVTTVSAAAATNAGAATEVVAGSKSSSDGNAEDSAAAVTVAKASVGINAKSESQTADIKDTFASDVTTDEGTAAESNAGTVSAAESAAAIGDSNKDILKDSAAPANSAP